MAQMSWQQWQQQVLSKIRRDYADILQHLTLDDIDWSAWRSLYDDGRSASEAVDCAFVRNQPLNERHSRHEPH